MNNMFLRKDGDMSMHAVILYHEIFGVRNGKNVCFFLSWKSGKKIPDLHVHFSWWITCSLCVRSGSNACCFFIVRKLERKI